MHTAEYPGENVRVLCLDKNGLGPPDRAGLQYANLYQTQEETTYEFKHMKSLDTPHAHAPKLMNQ